MRVMMKIKIDTEAGSQMIRDGSMPQFMSEQLPRLQPEAAYFGPEDGIRTAFLVINLDDPSRLPDLTEPFFGKLKAKVEIFPVMNLEDLQRGLQQLGGSG